MFKFQSSGPVNVLTLFGKRDFADVIKNLEMGLSGWVQCNHEDPYE